MSGRNQHTWGPPDPSLREYATPRQAEVLDAVLRCGSVPAAADELGVRASTLHDRLYDLKKRAARRGWSPEHDMTHDVPEGFHLKGVSTYYGDDGKVRGQWVKTQIDREHRLEMLREELTEFAEPFAGASEFAEPPATSVEDLLCVYPLGDPHIGMYAWAQETGCSFDLAIAEREIVCAVDQLVELAPPAKHALIADLGDFFHSDTSDNRTLRAGNPLDIDTRWPKVIRVGLRIIRRLIDRALLKHETVRVVIEIGNHDDHSAAMLAMFLAEYYSNNPRVRVDDSPDTYHWLRFGKNLIGVTHGHRVKARDLAHVMACDRAKDWGETEYRHWYTGHVHHDTLKEYPGVTVETFRTLAPADAWHHHSGYRSGRDLKVDIWHREYGMDTRHIVGIRRVWDALRRADANQGGEGI